MGGRKKGQASSLSSRRGRRVLGCDRISEAMTVARRHSARPPRFAGRFPPRLCHGLPASLSGSSSNLFLHPVRSCKSSPSPRPARHRMASSLSSPTLAVRLPAPPVSAPAVNPAEAAVAVSNAVPPTSEPGPTAAADQLLLAPDQRSFLKRNQVRRVLPGAECGVSYHALRLLEGRAEAPRRSAELRPLGRPC